MKNIQTASQPEPPTTIRVGCGLRDFFIARSGAEMLQAYEGLRALLRGLPAPEDPDVIEFAFNRLFVGPKAPIAPPFASIYLEKDELVMGRATQEARDLYAAVGLSSPWRGTFPEDHIALEIDACLHLRQLQHHPQGKEIAELYRRFLREHLLEWAPQFAGRISSAEAVPATIRATADLMMDWLHQEIT
ncbi:dehydrogenase [Desulfuromonas versatilis]|uniref:Dehydrogenase n=1 Tax=Desulfuromonas versatilis TaxID=2802975 RepID=A0ABM8HRS5_9BACT|nr:molecular chaperone TorD family protein [Desulfuromonas versatilis]BCR03167.1 dehydrogenase [Desulfuromonas versatilis]